MAKKGKLNKTEKYCMEKMFEDGHGFDEIAKFIDRTEASVEKYLSSLVEEEEKTPKKKNSTMFYRRTAAKNNKGVSIMNESESTRSEVEKSKSQSKIGKRFRPTTHIICDDDG